MLWSLPVAAGGVAAVHRAGPGAAWAGGRVGVASLLTHKPDTHTQVPLLTHATADNHCNGSLVRYTGMVSGWRLRAVLPAANARLRRGAVPCA